MHNFFWFRRDLRLHDNAGLYHALRAGQPVIPVFIFDRHILDELQERSDARVQFIHDTLTAIDRSLHALGSALIVRYGKPEEVWPTLLNEYDANAIYTNRDYEPYAKSRDNAIAQLAEARGVAFHTFKDHVIFEADEVCKKDGLPYTVFTPYSKKWRAKLATRLIESTHETQPLSYYFKPYPIEPYQAHFAPLKPQPIPTLADMGFAPSSIDIPPIEVPRRIIKQYDQNRNFPAIEGTSRLGIHFRFGTISIRQKARNAQLLNDTYLNELIWRDFYAQILDQFPHVVGHAFRAKYDAIPWRNDEADFEKWKAGKTGYPIVDAGMRELNATGYMHNRVRMIVASFLTKHLLIDWRWGEAYFAEKLLDFELASNNGGWQWAAGSGTDAAPYFRVFNPESQMQKFDKEGKYVKRWVPEWGTFKYGKPMVDHKAARARCLEVYKTALDNYTEDA